MSRVLALAVILALLITARGSDVSIIREKILPLLNLTEKVGLMGNNAGSAPNANIDKYQWWGEALHGVAGSPSVHFEDTTPFATSFPQVITTAASFNATLFAMIGASVGDEARAFINDGGTAGRTFWTPNVNIFRDPRWGRGQETPGEDPFLTSLYAENFVKSFQAETQVPVPAAADSLAPQASLRRVKASSCCKHFFDYNLEQSDGVSRLAYDARPTKQDIADTYLPAFEACVKRGAVTSLMCSYNAVNGAPSCANEWLLDDVARSEWGFQGYITSDCGAVKAIFESHNYTASAVEAVQAALAAGTDLDCGPYYFKYLEQAVEDGVVHQELLDQALVRLFQVQFWLGLYDKRFYPTLADPFVHIRYATHGPDNRQHRQLALEASKQGMVLLENEGATLPLQPSASWCDADFSLALIGPHVHGTTVMLGNYHGSPPFIVSPLAGLVRQLGQRGLPCVVNVTAAAGCDEVDSCPQAQREEAAQLAKRASAVVLVVGIDQSQERENQDRTSLMLPDQQLALLQTVAAALPSSTPAVMVVLSGGPLDLRPVPPSLKKALLWAGYPGQSGGQAIAEALLGEAPSGRLPVSWYPEELTKTSHMSENRMRAFTGRGVLGDTCSPGRTYRFYQPSACPHATGLQLLYHFGYGLSSYGQAWTYALPAAAWSNDRKELHLSLRVTPPAQSSSPHSLLLFAVPPPGVVAGQPRRFLVGIAHAGPAGTSTVAFALIPAQHMRLAADGKGPTGSWVEPDFFQQKWALEFGCIPGTPRQECARLLVTPPANSQMALARTPEAVVI